MARNKYPEETEKRILDAAEKLFLEKGYEKTSLQDIINHLGGLSKGAIYHHFKSKEDILIAVADRMGGYVEVMMRSIMDDKQLNGREKLSLMFRRSLTHNQQSQMFGYALDFSKSPGLLSIVLYDSVENVARQYIEPILKEGIRDGSIQTDYPQEAAEVLMLLGNVWLNPMIFKDDMGKLERKFYFYKQLTDALGLDILEDDMLGCLKDCSKDYYKNAAL